MASEYASKYASKSDAINLNGPLLQCASVLADKTLPVERKSKLVMSKIQNHVNKAIVYPLTMQSSYLLGHGDYWWPMKTCKHDGLLFQRALKPRQTAYEDEVFNVTFAPGNHTTPSNDHPALPLPHNVEDGQPATRQVQAINAETMYIHRHEALTKWSPYEMTMAFECCLANTTASSLLKVKREFPSVKQYGHKPYLNKEGKPVIHIPQLFRDPPLRPDPEAPSDDKEEYAAFALGNFYPYDRLLNDLKGDQLWDKFLFWEEHRPRKEKDDFAMMCLANYQVRAQARLQMRVESKKLNMQRRLVTAAAAPLTRHGEMCYDSVSIVNLVQVLFHYGLCTNAVSSHMYVIHLIIPVHSMCSCRRATHLTMTTARHPTPTALSSRTTGQTRTPLSACHVLCLWKTFLTPTTLCPRCLQSLLAKQPHASPRFPTL